jgi:MerR family transcriptional regulator, repressor of the yfmOP operon
MSDSPLRIGKVAEMTGTTPRTIRYYEEIGLLPQAPGREPGEHRAYEQADVERLTEVLRLKHLLGLSLDELKELAAMERGRAALRSEWRGGVEDPVRRRQILEEGVELIERQLGLVRRRRDEIRKLEAELGRHRRRLRGRLRELEREARTA